MKKGLFISFEGPDGAGKSTQLAMLAEYCRSKGLDITVTREPGGTSISEKIRCIILDPENSEMSASCEALLYAASRAQLIDQLIRPAVEEGRIVLCDRFVDSSIAYQAYARGLGEGVRLINRFAIKGTMPDCTFFLDIDPEKGRERNVDAGKKDRMEQEELSKFSTHQILTLLGFLVVIIASAFFKRNVGLISFAVGVLLVLLKAADEKQVFKTISWSTLIMVTGFGMLMETVIKVGGVTMLSNALASIMTPKTAVAIQGLTAGIMSWFSSAIGVVWPTLVPTVGDIAAQVGVSPNGLISIMCLTAAFAGLSPASTGGCLIMAANATDPEFTKEKENKLFIQLFGISALMVILIVIAALLGLYSIL